MSHAFSPSPTGPHVETAVARAARAIPPLWPLASSVAVNPFLGQAGEDLATAAARLARVAGVGITMPRRWYHQKISAGIITDADLQDAWACAPTRLRPANVSALKSATAANLPKPVALPSIADLAADVSRIDWPGLISERFGA